jgi:hypothetical protein
MTRHEALQQMATSLQRREPAVFFVGLVGYFIEGCAYMADGLSVDAVSTPNLVLTDDGFDCDASSPAEMLEPATVMASGTREFVVEGRSIVVVSVRLHVRRDDIWSVTQSIAGQKHELFRDIDQLVEKEARVCASVTCTERSTAESTTQLGWLTNPKRAAYNRVYNRTTRGCAVGLAVLLWRVLIISAAVSASMR